VTAGSLLACAVAMVMEAMLPELDDLESKGYFSRFELKEVIKKRQDFEYNFKRRAALKRDFLRCCPLFDAQLTA